nr:type II toxin-antitoxin system RelE/ParE family toxin [Rhodoblastus sphagnicola]
MWAYVASENSEDIANKLIAKITAVFDRAAQFPMGNPLRPQLGPALRVAFSGSYAIYYLPSDSEIIVVRVLHGARDLAALIEHGGFST